MKNFWSIASVVSIFLAILHVDFVCAGSSGPSDGYYRSTNDTKVYWISKQNWYCHVQNPTQMETFGGFNQIRDVHDVSQYLKVSRDNGDCTWPDGVYKSTVDPTTFWLYEGNKFCWISSGPMLNAVLAKTRTKVLSVEPGSEIKMGRKYTDQCNWP